MKMKMYNNLSLAGIQRCRASVGLALFGLHLAGVNLLLGVTILNMRSSEIILLQTLNRNRKILLSSTASFNSQSNSLVPKGVWKYNKFKFIYGGYHLEVGIVF